MDEGVTPNELARDLRVSPTTIRRWLRAQGWQSLPHTRWRLSAEQVARVRARFTR